MSTPGKQGKNNVRYKKPETPSAPSTDTKSFERVMIEAGRRLHESRPQNRDCEMEMLRDLTGHLEELWERERKRIDKMKAQGASEQRTQRAEKQYLARHQQLRRIEEQMEEIESLKALNEFFDVVRASMGDYPPGAADGGPMGASTSKETRDDGTAVPSEGAAGAANGGAKVRAKDVVDGGARVHAKRNVNSGVKGGVKCRGKGDIDGVGYAKGSTKDGVGGVGVSAKRSANGGGKGGAKCVVKSDTDGAARSCAKGGVGGASGSSVKGSENCSGKRGAKSAPKGDINDAERVCAKGRAGGKGGAKGSAKGGNKGCVIHGAKGGVEGGVKCTAGCDDN